MPQVVLEEPGRLALRDARVPEPGPGEALVRVHRVGVCGTDLHAFRGEQPFFSYPRVLGHELSVTVEAIDGPSDVSAGDRCAVRPYIDDPTSSASLKGRTNCCQNLRVLGVHVDGGMTRFLTLPSRLLHRSALLSLDQLALVEPLGIGCHAVERAQPARDERVLVIGAGPIGVSIVLFTRLLSPDLTVLDRSEGRVARCREGFGVQRAVTALAEGERFDCVFDATGSRESMAAAFERVDHGGRLVLVGLFQGDLSFHDPLFHAREMTVLASRNATAETARRVVAALEAGEVAADPFVTHRMPLAEAPGRFEALFGEPGLFKALIEVD